MDEFLNINQFQMWTREEGGKNNLVDIINGSLEAPLARFETFFIIDWRHSRAALVAPGLVQRGDLGRARRERD